MKAVLPSNTGIGWCLNAPGIRHSAVQAQSQGWGLWLKGQTSGVRHGAATPHGQRKKKYRESRRPTGIFLDWPVQLLTSVFLMVGRDWGGWGELENALQMTGAHWEGQESTEMLPLKTKEWLMKTGTSGYSGKCPCLNAKMRAKITTGL